MSAPPDSAEFAARRAPPGRAPVMSAPFWAMMILAACCLLAAVLVVVVGPRLLAVRRAAPSAAAPSSPAPSLAMAAASTPPPGVPLPAPGDLAGLETRFGVLEAGQTRILDAASRALAVAVLSEAANQPRPFAQTLSQFEPILPPTAILALTPLALKGAPTRAELAVDLDDVATRAAVEARAPTRTASLGARLAYALSRLVSIRRVDPSGSGPDGLIVRAQMSAAAGDTEGALALIDQLPPASSQVLKVWREDAVRRIDIDRDVSALQIEAAANLASARKAPP